MSRSHNGFFPNCEYCGRFVDHRKPETKSWTIYGWMTVERIAYAHALCAEKDKCASCGHMKADHYDGKLGSLRCIDENGIFYGTLHFKPITD